MRTPNWSFQGVQLRLMEHVTRGLAVITMIISEQWLCKKKCPVSLLCRVRFLFTRTFGGQWISMGPQKKEELPKAVVASAWKDDDAWGHSKDNLSSRSWSRATDWSEHQFVQLQPKECHHLMQRCHLSSTPHLSSSQLGSARIEQAHCGKAA